MYIRTIAREWRVSHRNTAVAALPPGTVESRLSAPFIGGNYRKRVLQPVDSATALLAVMSRLTSADSGRFFDWQGLEVPW